MDISDILDTPDASDTPSTASGGDAAPRKRLRGAANPRARSPRSSRGAWPPARPAPRAFPCCPAGTRTMSGARAAGWRRAVQRRSRESTVSGPHLSREPYRLRLLPVPIPHPTSLTAGGARGPGQRRERRGLTGDTGAERGGRRRAREQAGSGRACSRERGEARAGLAQPPQSLCPSLSPAVRPSVRPLSPAAGAAPSGRRRRRRVPSPPARR